MSRLIRIAAMGLLLLGCFAAPSLAADVSILNASYDPTRELYQDLNAAFAKDYKAKGGDNVTVQMSHGGSGPQAQKIINGLPADVASLSVAFDIDKIADAGLLPPDWASRFPHHASPYSSTIVFLVRKGNPRQVHDWPDLVKPGIQLLMPSPKTGGGGRWIFLAAWGQALRANSGDEAKARDYAANFYANAVALAPAMRGSTTSFVRQGIGDVLVGWENEILQTIHEPGAGDQYEVVVPTTSIDVEVPIAIVDSNVDTHGNRTAVQAYINYIFSPAGQEIIAQHYNRPRDAAVLARHAAQFPGVKLFTLADTFGDWKTVTAKFFADGAIFDQFSRK